MTSVAQLLEQKGHDAMPVVEQGQPGFEQGRNPILPRDVQVVDDLSQVDDSRDSGAQTS